MLIWVWGCRISMANLVKLFSSLTCKYLLSISFEENDSCALFSMYSVNVFPDDELKDKQVLVDWFLGLVITDDDIQDNVNGATYDCNDQLRMVWHNAWMAICMWHCRTIRVYNMLTCCIRSRLMKTIKSTRKGNSFLKKHCLRWSIEERMDSKNEHTPFYIS